jgi:hypothetical protein
LSVRASGTVGARFPDPEARRVLDRRPDAGRSG